MKKKKRQESAICFTNHMSSFPGYSHLQSWFLETSWKRRAAQDFTKPLCFCLNPDALRRCFQGIEDIKVSHVQPCEAVMQGQENWMQSFYTGRAKRGSQQLVLLETISEQQTWAPHSLPLPHSSVTVEPTLNRHRCKLSAKEAPSGRMLEEHEWWRKCAPGASPGSSPI